MGGSNSTSDSSSNFFGSGTATSLVTTAGSIGLTALQNDGKDIQGKYQQALAELKAKSDVSSQDFQIQLAKINADYQTATVANQAAQSKSKLTLIGLIAGLMALTVIVVVLIIKRSAKTTAAVRPVGSKPTAT